jgi:hypothetical protein
MYGVLNVGFSTTEDAYMIIDTTESSPLCSYLRPCWSFSFAYAMRLQQHTHSLLVGGGISISLHYDI